jgi:glycosyltransferase involved in cell wall biosynthesis
MNAEPGHILCCNAPYGSGGLGQHFAQIVEAAREQGELARYYTAGIKPGDDGVGIGISTARHLQLCKIPPIRHSPGWKNHLVGDLFDRAVSRRLDRRCDTLTCFGGQALRTFRKARALGCPSLHLMAANSHVENVYRLHEKAARLHPFEASWLNRMQVRKTLAEYQAADVIHAASEYTRQTFLAAGFPEAKLRRLHLVTNPRFTSAERLPADGVFRVVNTGTLTVMKGIPLLVEAFSRLAAKDAELWLIGGWSTRGMRKYLQQAMRADPRIHVAPGDPLPHLARASVYVHPSWEDGWAYSAAEAVACGVPVIVTEDTGMKELIREGANGYIVPTGDGDAIYERLSKLYQSSRG